jgi:hypothetical protein
MSPVPAAAERSIKSAAALDCSGLFPFRLSYLKAAALATKRLSLNSIGDIIPDAGQPRRRVCGLFCGLRVFCNPAGHRHSLSNVF